MIELIFEGYSDDTFGETNHFKDDYDNCASGEPIEWLVRNDNYAIVVTGQYCPGSSGSWMIGVANHDPDALDVDFPTWKMMIQVQSNLHKDHGFNPQLVIHTPDDVTIECLQRH